MSPSAQDHTSDSTSLLEHGWLQMHARQWTRAHELFSRATAADEHSARGWEALAAASMCLDEFEGARRALERAYCEAQRINDGRAAARAAMQLAVYHDSFRGESAIANGWFERARLLLPVDAPSPEQAWLALWEAHVEIHVRGDVVAGHDKLEEALRHHDACRAGREFDLLARGLLGLTAISDGAIDDGLRRLDEVTAAATTELSSPQTVGWTCCYVLDACERVRDFDRAAQWVERGFAAGRELAIPHFSAFCRSHYIGVLIWRGEYGTAERQIEQAHREVGPIAPVYSAQFDIRLGEVRRRQGRLDEAARLVEPHGAHPLGMLTLASIALDRARPQLSSDLAERYLRRVPAADRVRRLHGLEPLVRARLRLGDLDAAHGALQEARRFAHDARAPLMCASVDELDGIAAVARGELDAARHHLEDAIDTYELNSAPYEATTARLELTAVLRRLGRHDSADAVWRAARAGAERLGAALLVTRAGQLAAVNARRTAPCGLTAREIEVLRLVAEGVSNQQIGQRLSISAFTVKRHIANILTKIDAPSRAAAAAFAVREGLFQ
jgi:LuxR family transcriptional regulator, maltose regulon positive regulatory protein